MKQKKNLPNWRVLWILLFFNTVLLIFALFDQGVWYVVASLLWSIGILMYQSKKMSKNKKAVEDAVIEDCKVKRNRYISIEP